MIDPVSVPRRDVAAMRDWVAELLSDIDKTATVDILFCDKSGTCGALVAESEI